MDYRTNSYKSNIKYYETNNYRLNCGDKSKYQSQYNDHRNQSFHDSESNSHKQINEVMGEGMRRHLRDSAFMMQNHGLGAQLTAHSHKQINDLLHF